LTFYVTGDTGDVAMEGNDAGTAGPILSLFHQSASPADNDIAGTIQFEMENSNNEQVINGKIEVIADDVSNGTEDADMTFSVIDNSSLDEVMRLEGSTGDIGIGTTTPDYRLDLEDNTTATPIARFSNYGTSSAGPDGIRIYITGDGSMSSNNMYVAFANGSDTLAGAIWGNGNNAVSYDTDGADYAEFFQTVDTDLIGGEVVCVDVARENSVKRCLNERDSNIMGIISDYPAFLGNGTDEEMDDPNYTIVGMLGQVPAFASNENGEIRPGDSLTSASIPGYVMRADSGDSTVGVALEGLEGDIGTIQVMISRRNKSFTVAEIEEKVTARIAEMEIEDEVQIMISSAVNNLNLDQEIYDVIRPMITIAESNIALVTDALGNDISTIDGRVIQNTFALEDLQTQLNQFALASTTEMLENRIVNLEDTSQTIQGQITDLEATASTTLALIQSLLDGGDNNDLPVVDNPDLDIQTLAVQQAATFYGTITVIGEAGFESKVVFNQDIEVKGKIYASADQAGTAIIAANSTSTEVVFEGEYEVVPKVTATARQPIALGISDQTSAGFHVFILEPQGQDLTFDWIALAVKSDGEPVPEPVATPEPAPVPEPIPEPQPEEPPVEEPPVEEPAAEEPPVEEPQPEPIPEPEPEEPAPEPEPPVEETEVAQDIPEPEPEPEPIEEVVQEEPEPEPVVQVEEPIEEVVVEEPEEGVGGPEI
jgi:hypothetical protein